jgi:hypothetical protein
MCSFRLRGSLGWCEHLGRGPWSARRAVRGAASASERAPATPGVGGRGPAAGTRRCPGCRPCRRGERDDRAQGSVRTRTRRGDLPVGRVRRAGGGRKPITQLDPELQPALLALVEPDERSDPMSPLRWTTKSLRHLADELTVVEGWSPLNGEDLVGSHVVRARLLDCDESVRNPTVSPVPTDLGRQPRQLTLPPGRAQSPPVSPSPRSMCSAAATMSAANPMRTTRRSSSRLTAAPANAAAAPAPPTRAAMRHLICRARNRGMTAAAEEIPTTSSEVGTAAVSGWPAP